MNAVRDDALFALRSPKTSEPLKHVNARKLWQKILEIRLQTGEPYIIFSDTVNSAMPTHQREARPQGAPVESLLGNHAAHRLDHHGEERTAVCCLSSLNAETCIEWEKEPDFIEDVFRFLDNVLQDFIERAPTEMERANYAAYARAHGRPRA